MSFQTVEQLQATVASQAAEIEELKNRLSVLDEFRISSQNTLIAANEAHVGEMQAEIERLRELMSRWEKYVRVDRVFNGIEFFEKLVFDTRAALQPKEGE